jgi:excisionase family DNA binding protein
MLSIILLLVGFLIINREELHLNFLDIHASGSPIRVAGRILMLPFFGSIVLGLVAGLLTNGDFNALLNLLYSLAVVELIVVLVCVTLAYLILRQNQVPDYLSFFGQSSVVPPSANTARPTAPKEFPSVMTTQQAAQYLNVPEKRIIDAIYQGEIAASHMNNRYVISRSVLDEFRTQL